MKYEILAKEGTEGYLPGEGMEYSVGSGRIKIVKNGETILDDEYKTGPEIKYIIDGDEIPVRLHSADYEDHEERGPGIDDKVKADEVDEFSVGAMLPQPAPAILTTAESELIKSISFGKPIVEFVLNDEQTELGFIQEGLDDTVRNMKTDVNVSQKIRGLIVDIAVLKAKVKVLSAKEDTKLKVIDVKKEIIAKEKELRELLKSASDEEKAEIKKLEKEAAKKAEGEVNKEIKESPVAESIREYKLIREFTEGIDGEVVTESFFSQAKKYKDRIDEIQQTKPDIYDDVKNIDEFLDKNMNDIKKISTILDKEVDEITENNTKTILTYLTAFIPYIIGAAASPSGLPVVIGGVAMLIMFTCGMIGSILNYIKATNDTKYMSDLTNIKKRLSKITDNNKLPQNVKKKLISTIAAIEEAETKYTARVTTKESTIVDTYIESFVNNDNRIKELSENKLLHQSEIKTLYEENADLLWKINYFMHEAANIEGEIKPIIDEFNKKGYNTKYSSPGHNKLRKKEDKMKDGTYYGKLYSDARVMFDGKYNFPSAPKYWMWKNVEGNDYLDVIPIKYDEKDGTPDEAFTKWKDAYMSSLKSFVSSLQYANNAKGDDNGPKDEHKSEDLKKESTDNVDINDIIDFFIMTKVE